LYKKVFDIIDAQCDHEV